MRMKTCIALIKATRAIASLACCMYVPAQELVDRVVLAVGGTHSLPAG